MKKFDVIVVGAGPAGVAASKVLKDNNISFCVIDKCIFPREKLCGGGLTNKSINALNKLGLVISKINIEETSEIELVFENKKYTLPLNNKIIMVDRKDFDKNNLDKIKCEVFMGENIVSINDNILKTDKDDYEFKYIVFADGVNGYSKKLIKKREFGFCVEYKSSKKTNKTVLDFDIVKDGYGWIFPKKDFTTVGLGNYNRKRVNYHDLLSSFAKKYNFEFDKTQIRGYHIPVFLPSVYKQSVIDNKYILVGDAASLVDPISGEGIYYALVSGKSASESIIESINNKKDLKTTYFEKTNSIYRSLRKRKALSKLLYSKHKSFYINLGLKNKKNIDRLNRMFG